MIELEPIFGGTSESDIKDVEAKLRLTFPPDYARFLQQFNGGRPYPDGVYVPRLKDWIPVAFFYGIAKKGMGCDLETEYHRADGRLLEGMLPIGRDPGGNSFVMATTGSHQGRIYYWDSAGHFETSHAQGNTYVLADSFTAFLESLAVPVP